MRVSLIVSSLLFSSYSLAETYNWTADSIEQSEINTLLSNKDIDTISFNNKTQLNGALTLPDSVNVNFGSSGIIHGNGEQVQILGNIEAGKHKIFDNLSVKLFTDEQLGKTTRAIPQWFGATTSSQADAEYTSPLDADEGRKNMWAFQQTLAATNAGRQGAPIFFIPAGIYVLDSPNGQALRVNSFQHIMGEGQNSVLTLAKASVPYSLFSVMQDSAANINFSNFSVFGNYVCGVNEQGETEYCQTENITAIDFSSVNAPAIYSSVNGLQIKEMSASGIAFGNRGGENITIKNNLIRDSRLYNIYAESLVQSQISDNVIRSSKKVDGGSIYLALRWAHQKLNLVTISNNTIEDNKGYGIVVSKHAGVSFEPDRMTINGNRLSGDHMSGVHIEHGNKIAISNNFFHTSGAAINLSGLDQGHVNGNTIVQGGEAVIYAGANVRLWGNAVFEP